MAIEESTTNPQAEQRKKRVVVELPEDLLKQVKAADLDFWGGEPISNSKLVENALRLELTRLNEVNKLLEDRDYWRRSCYYEERTRMREHANRRHGKKAAPIDDIPW